MHYARWAMGDTATVPLLGEALRNRQFLGEAVTRKLMRDFRLYMLVGGMPQAVNAYLETNNLTDVDTKKREIIEIYLDDFLKIDPSGKASRLFTAIPAELTKNASRYQVTSVLGRSENKDTMDELLKEMEDSLTVNFAHHANDPNVGLPMATDYSQYKMYVGDTGLSSPSPFGTRTSPRTPSTRNSFLTSFRPTSVTFMRTSWLKCSPPQGTNSSIIHGRRRPPTTITKSILSFHAAAKSGP